MADELIACYRHDLRTELKQKIDPHLTALEEASYHTILTLPLVQTLLSDSLHASLNGQQHAWKSAIDAQLESTLSKAGDDSSYTAHVIFIAALAALQAFQQSNVTGPPLPFDSAKVIFPPEISDDPKALQQARQNLINDFSVDGIGAYKLTPNIELLSLADALLTDGLLGATSWTAKWARMRTSFLQQRILSEESSSLQSRVYDLMGQVGHRLAEHTTALPEFLQEQAAIHTHHGNDRQAREALDQATRLTGFEFALTGLLGKRTKWQENALSQLVVLAKSNDATTKASPNGNAESKVEAVSTKPENLDLNDDTLLESISFTEKTASSSTDMKAADSLPLSLLALDPGKQPLLLPVDSITLLLYASSITNTSPTDGLTREETLPYATRVLDGGSSNWQVYTQALLVRSRIEGYRSRTAERGLLQLQALVDQVIAETAPSSSPAKDTESDSMETSTESKMASENTQTTFLPRASAADSAPASQRLRYIYPLCAPTRWELEAELAERWVTLGGLRSALEIYERLEMWAEAALCLAATEREDKARAIVRKQLFHCTAGQDKDEAVTEGDGETWSGPARSPSPPDAPRLYCILGDIDADPSMYETAWSVSGNRYARAQRSLGRLAFAAKDFPRAAAAYKLAVSQNQLNGSSWFALGCAQLEMQDFVAAADSFTRTVQLDDTDAEAWSNLASALLNLEPEHRDKVTITAQPTLDDEDFSQEDAASTKNDDPQRHKKDALKALNKAASIKFNNYRIWDNMLTVAASIIPPAYSDVVAAQKRIIDMRGSTDGEKCVDETILEYLVRHIIAISADPETGKPEYVPGKPGLQRMVIEMVDKQVVPLITASPRLWGSVARLALWRGRPSSALEAHEKAWRAVTAQPGWETTTEARWNAVVDATIELADAYESLGQMEKTEGLAAGSGELVAKGWQFKARSAVRSVMGKGKELWEDGVGWKRLQECMQGLKS